ncbi:defender against death DAD protein [Tilletiopsis washingtonensis]|uniref:Dolichyl-diphosphooligosaccharide--protein glycosyltransferase subunit OST2 n=1 Tax=Tilletiopsis washingtonensis TaxID=58919 RepID=A0A316ZGL8_9BASI|nr:defender against death DAD protein [Tilletiopsis washingtonensis]PWO00620.1 defender against death DAD protein [Tilletiopsis washingtonensis]
MPPKRTASGPAPPVVATAGSSSTAREAAASSPLVTLQRSYLAHTPARLRLLDAFMAFLVLSGVLQFVYCIAISNFPLNSFIAGFASTVGQFVLCASLRIQANEANAAEFPKNSPERAFGDFLFASVVLHFFVVNFLG